MRIFINTTMQFNRLWGRYARQTIVIQIQHDIRYYVLRIHTRI